METPGFKMDLAGAWIEDEEKINVKALKIEIDSAPIAVECPESEDVEAAKATFLGTWEGKTNFGARIRVIFDPADILTGLNLTHGREFTRKYQICGNEAIWLAANGVRITGSVSENRERLIIKYKMGDTPAVDTFSRK
jgi:hypothetical protein